jgi:hypothetical protein
LWDFSDQRLASHDTDQPLSGIKRVSSNAQAFFKMRRNVFEMAKPLGKARPVIIQNGIFSGNQGVAFVAGKAFAVMATV